MEANFGSTSSKQSQYQIWAKTEMNSSKTASQKTFTCSNLTIEELEKV